MTVERLKVLYNAMNEQCQFIGKLLLALENAEADEDIYEMAESVESLWSILAEAVAKRLIELHGANGRR